MKNVKLFGVDPHEKGHSIQNNMQSTPNSLTFFMGINPKQFNLIHGDQPQTV
jgi:hypothetical protein